MISRKEYCWLAPLDVARTVQIVAIVLIGASFIGIFFCKGCDNKTEILVAIANALLLYTTLAENKRGNDMQSAASKKERFETTFFNLLKSHRELVDEISINRPSVREDDISEIRYILFKGRQFFSFAMIDINNITKNLKSQQLSYYNADDALQQEVYLEQCIYDSSIDVNSQRRQSIQASRESMVNTYYHITKELQKEFKQNPHLPYQLFASKHKKYYEHYVRSLIHLLKYINDNSHMEDIYVYTNIVRSQMSEDEYNFILWLGPQDPEISQLMRNIGLYNK